MVETICAILYSVESFWLLTYLIRFPLPQQPTQPMPVQTSKRRPVLGPVLMGQPLAQIPKKRWLCPWTDCLWTQDTRWMLMPHPPSRADLLPGGPSRGRVDSQKAWWCPLEYSTPTGLPWVVSVTSGHKANVLTWAQSPAPTQHTIVLPELSMQRPGMLRGLPRSLCRLARISHQKARLGLSYSFQPHSHPPTLGLPGSPMSLQSIWTWILTSTLVTRKTPALMPSFFPGCTLRHVRS